MEQVSMFCCLRPKLSESENLFFLLTLKAHVVEVGKYWL